MNDHELRIKLFIDSRRKRVAFAEAGSEFIDFLCHMLSLPIATVVELLGKGSLANLHGSIQNLNANLRPRKKFLNKVSKFKPKVPFAGMSTASVIFPAACGGGGGLSNYMVMDDLTVMPLSTSSTITLLKKLELNGLADLEEKVVRMGNDVAVKLMKTSLQSKNVLSDVFLKDSNRNGDSSPGPTAGVKRERTT